MKFPLLIIFLARVALDGIVRSQENELDSIHQKVELARKRLEEHCPHLIPDQKWFVTRALDKDFISQTINKHIETKLHDALQKLLKDCGVDDSKQTQTSSKHECLSIATVNLTHSWRNLYDGNDLLNTDKAALSESKAWFRFVGDAGRRLKDTCPTQYSCGSTGAYWSDEKMPANVGESVEFRMYESWSSDGLSKCKEKSYKAKATRCSKQGDFVYKLEGKMSDGLDTVCGMN